MPIRYRREKRRKAAEAASIKVTSWDMDKGEVTKIREVSIPKAVINDVPSNPSTSGKTSKSAKSDGKAVRVKSDGKTSKGAKK